MSSCIMTFHISIDREKISRMVSPYGSAVIIPFSGSVNSEHFKGTVLPGAADVQTVDACGVRHMCAKYMFEGIDKEGRSCRLFVENNGWFRDTVKEEYFHAQPSFMSDSPYLSELLSRPVYRSEGHSTPQGVDIMIFDVSQERKWEEPEEVKKPANDPFFDTLIVKAIDDEKAIEEAARIMKEEKVKKLVYFSASEKQAFCAEEPNEEIIAGVLHDIRETMQMGFMINEKGQLAAIAWIAGKIRNIEDSSLTVFAEIFEETGGSKYFERPLNRYPRWRIQEF